MRFKDNVWSGLLMSFLLPCVVFFLLTSMYGLLESKGITNQLGLSPNFRERTSAIIAIAANLLPLNIFQNRRWSHAIRGTVIATSILAFGWVAYYGLSFIQ